MKKTNSAVLILFFSFFTAINLISCATTTAENLQNSSPSDDLNPADTEAIISDQGSAFTSDQENTQYAESPEKNEITLLFGGDIMAHSVNYQISTYSKIWRDIKDITIEPDLTFANLEAPIDTTKAASSYPNFNTTRKYVQAAIDAGFDVFSLCNNHTNDQGLTGIKETIKTAKALEEQALTENHNIYFSGLKENSTDSLTYNVINKNGWKILFLPITELLNRPTASDYINFITPDEEHRKDFIQFCRQLRQDNPCDLFIISIHTCEPEYTRAVTDTQNQYYEDLLQAGADVIWANHAHIIKNRKIIVNSQNKTTKLIMYANGNTISGQRTKPDLTSKNPNGERDNTGDGLLYKVTYKREKNGAVPYIYKAEPIYITTYINTAQEYVIKKLDMDFVSYLYDVPRKSWAEYITRRIKINKDTTKDLIEWQ